MDDGCSGGPAGGGHKRGDGGVRRMIARLPLWRATPLQYPVAGYRVPASRTYVCDVVWCWMLHLWHVCAWGLVSAVVPPACLRAPVCPHSRSAVRHLFPRLSRLAHHVTLVRHMFITHTLSLSSLGAPTFDVSRPGTRSTVALAAFCSLACVVGLPLLRPPTEQAPPRTACH